MRRPERARHAVPVAQAQQRHDAEVGTGRFTSDQQPFGTELGRSVVHQPPGSGFAIVGPGRERVLRRETVVHAHHGQPRLLGEPPEPLVLPVRRPERPPPPWMCRYTPSTWSGTKTRTFTPPSMTRSWPYGSRTGGASPPSRLRRRSASAAALGACPRAGRLAAAASNCSLNAKVSGRQSSSVIVMPSTVAAVRDNPLSPFPREGHHAHWPEGPSAVPCRPLGGALAAT